MLIEYDKVTKRLINMTSHGTHFIELPETSESLIIDDVTIAELILQAHVNRNPITVVVDENGKFVSADFELYVPPVVVPDKTIEDRLEELAREQAALILLLVEKGRI